MFIVHMCYPLVAMDMKFNQYWVQLFTYFFNFLFYDF